MTSRTSSIGEQEAYVQQYPLNIHLPFERYDHRRLAARDILVHRIISKLLYPGSKDLAEAFETHRSKENGLHNFGPIKRCDRRLAKDLELLRKMLVTCSQTEIESSLEPLRLATRCGNGLQKMLLELAQCEGANVRVTVGEEILDLVRRHYLENDDPSIRLYLQAIQPSIPSAYNSLPGLTRAKDTHAASAQQRQGIDEANRAHDEKKWYIDDVEHLRSLQKKVRTAQSLDLYDGGALLPSLRQPIMSSRAARKQYMGLESQEGGAIYHAHSRFPPGGFGFESRILHIRLILLAAEPDEGWIEMASGLRAAGQKKQEEEDGWKDADVDGHPANPLPTCSHRLGCR
ncbi:hypothetical protein VPNG_03075 [Cytospora leucostoma]|uniref:Uncharacterized protein n=1 Tax=Cytospora leucostoma TaxID=1230097 RepID=A0A423XGN8_9PEZI|nr:hypothetical protein VPNG_03075 [Cytospora leucostoma]